MPALKDLDLRLMASPSWQQMYDLNLSLSRKIADNVPLIHVTTGDAVLEIILSPDQEMRPSTEEISKSNTIKGEDGLGLDRSLYFYAGRAGFGEIALAFFDPDFETRHTGSATPFDSGGLFAGKIEWKQLARDPATLKRFYQDSLWLLKDWRESFARFLAAYFESPLDYWSKEPKMPDPEGILLHSDNLWRAWTVEVRVHEGENVSSRIAWCCTRPCFQSLAKAANGPPLGALPPTPVETFLRRPNLIAAPADDAFRKNMEAWVLDRWSRL